MVRSIGRDRRRFLLRIMIGLPGPRPFLIPLCRRDLAFRGRGGRRASCASAGTATVPAAALSLSISVATGAVAAASDRRSILAISGTTCSSVSGGDARVNDPASVRTRQKCGYSIMALHAADLITRRSTKPARSSRSCAIVVNPLTARRQGGVRSTRAPTFRLSRCSIPFKSSAHGPGFLPYCHVDKRIALSTGSAGQSSPPLPRYTINLGLGRNGKADPLRRTHICDPRPELRIAGPFVASTYRRRWLTE